MQSLENGLAALQCYDCHNCEDAEDFTELQICVDFSATVKPTQRTTTTTTSFSNNSSTTNTTALNTTRAPGNGEDSEYSDEEYEGIDDGPSANTTLRPGNIKTSQRTTTKRASTTQLTTTKRLPTSADGSEELDGDDSDNDSDYEDDRLLRRSNRMFGRADEFVCYMVKFKVNDSIVTNRGCTTMVRANNLLTCNSLTSGEELHDCQLCSTNGCNKFAEDDGTLEALWNGGEKVSTNAWFLMPFLAMLVLWH
ncbi:uncharacterized protein LOC128864799 [Anastrepha ludens]|uniref:uncharacterized protein LOC128864799 n=1 Tax=Anastrepha ludens TaxID=28586 RepID=UPI0023B0EB6E|nr:uncharacterized protein LOC128864799 [Anastrepha ludens]